MTSLLTSSLGRLRLISILEALSYIYLLYCSIYLKRVMGDDEAIKTPGMIHGVLFCIYALALFSAMIDAKWSLKTAFLVGLTSLFPIVPFLIDHWLKGEQKRVQRLLASPLSN